MVLAAGLATRMGEPKQLMQWRGKPILQHVIDAAEASCVDDVFVVLGHEAARVAAALRLQRGSRIVMNTAFVDGQASSLRAGLRAAGRAAAAVVLLGDQPGIRPHTIDSVVARWRHGGGPIVRCVRNGLPSHPVLLAKEIWSRLPASGDEGARHLIFGSPDLVDDLPVAEDVPDIDDIHDYRLMVERGQLS